MECTKKYTLYYGLWNHKKMYHIIKIDKNEYLIEDEYIIKKLKK